MGTEPGEQLQEEPQAARGPAGSRDSGPDEAGAGPSDRKSGSLDQEEVATTGEAGTDPGREHVAGPAGGSTPPGNAQAATPPYDGRTTSTAEGRPEHDEHVDANRLQDKDPDDTARGAVASPSEEKPAADTEQTESSDEGVGPAHETGVGKGEDKK
ncbi:hypothetical protein [Rhodococcus tibetensis]|uniref:Uncharacterized protein n=1 Tax=Rhodococcus tibetensis TaxID=2965064 RepID=A0ABT1Q862_9NOCA|nr:hypothetical protein [Rhodococcus sp. FXJ9.536]MCQ4118446.1 hypothetical protein [Rhodococcus sp. FXJ9.536]